MQSTTRLRLDLLPQFTICGGLPDDGDADTSTDEGGGTTDTGSAGSDSQNGSADEEIKDPKARIRALQEEKDRHFNALKVAERERDELRTAAEKAAREKMTADEKVKADLEAESKRATQLADSNRALALKIAFLSEGETQWHNPAAALRLVDLSDVQVEDDGTVKNPDVLTKAIKDLAKREPYLVKTAEPEEKPKNPPPASGSPATGRKPSGGVDQEALRRTYPALRSH